MATYTSNYGWTKPSGSDNVDISVLNDNLDDQDSTIHDAFLNMAPPFSESSTYAVDDIVLYGKGLYKCHTAVVTPGSWTGSTNWQVYKLSEGGSGGGGTSNYNQLTNKPQINSVELSGNKTAAQLGLMASDGGVANPTGQTAGSLTALEVGGTKYAVPSGGTSDYADLTNKPQINGVELSGNKTASQLGMANSNTFQGTIAEWNQLSTAEKKAYDHASIPDSIDGGVTFPANKVVMTGGGNVEEKMANHHLSGINTGLQVSQNWREMTIGFSPYPTAGTRQLFTQTIKRDTFDDFVDGVNFIMAEVYKDDTNATAPSRCQVKIEKNTDEVIVTPIICTWNGVDLITSAKIFVDYSE